MLERQREEIATACRALAAAGYVPRSSGNMSVLVGGRMAVTASGSALASMTASDVVVCESDGRLVEGESEPTSEIALHVAVYARGEVGAIVHTHAPFGTALACVVDEVPAVHYEMVALGGAVPVVPYATAGSAELASAAAAALDGRRAVLLANHGTVTTGVELASAVAATELLEWACALYWRAAQMGSPRVLGSDQLQAFAAALAAREC